MKGKNILFIALSFFTGLSAEAQTGVQTKEQTREENSELYFSAQADIFDGEMLQAIAKLKRITESDETDCDAQNLLCLCYAQLGDFNQASGYAEKIAALGCYDDRNLILLTDVLNKAKKQDASIELLQAYGEKYGYQRTVFDIEAKIHLEKNDILGYIKARRMYNVDAEDYMSGAVEIFYSTMLQGGGAKKAYKYLEKHSIQEPENYTILALLLGNYLESGNFQDGKNTLLKIVRLPNVTKDKKVHSVNAFRKAGFDNEKKEEVIKQALEIIEQ